MRSKKMNIGLAICVLLIQSKEILTTSQMANKLDISASYCEQIVASLSRGGLIEGKKGPKGGYKAGSNLAKTKIKLVMELFDPINETSVKTYNLIAGINSLENQIYLKTTINDLARKVA